MTQNSPKAHGFGGMRIGFGGITINIFPRDEFEVGWTGAEDLGCGPGTTSGTSTPPTTLSSKGPGDTGRVNAAIKSRFSDRPAMPWRTARAAANPNGNP